MTYNTSNNPNTGSGVGSAERTQDQLRHAAEQARDSAEQVATEVRQKAQETFDNVQGIDLKQQVQEHLWLALGAMIGAGYLLSRMSGGSEQTWERQHDRQGWQGYQNRHGYQGQQAWQGYQGSQAWGQQSYGGAMEQAKQYESSQREGMVGKLGRRMFASVSSLEELYHEKLQDLYDAEHQILKALPMMIEAASSHELKQAFDMHLRQTQGQIGRLEQVFHRLGMQPKGKSCTAMRGILAEGEETMAMRADPEVKDAALIAAAQHVEHHEIVAYGTLRTWARQLGHHDAAQLLQQTLTEEEQTDRQLTQLAERAINVRAARG
jgi:ferritin-like metal-binding protein YciE